MLTITVVSSFVRLKDSILKVIDVKVPSNRSSKKVHSGKRVDIAWAFVWGAGAVLFAAVAVGSYFFSPAIRGANDLYASLPLPPASGEVTTTGAVAADGETVNFAVYPSGGGLIAQQSTTRMQSEIATLRREIAGLRRNLSVLERQNDGLSRRLAAIEGGKHAEAQSLKPQEAGEPSSPAASATPETPRPRVETLPAPEIREVDEVHSKSGIGASASGVDSAAPVRIVALPPAGEPATVGSIPAEALSPGHETGEQPAPVLSIAPPAGKTDGEALSRTDFAADLGLYPSEDAARKTLSAIEEHLSLLSGDVEPRVRPAQAGKGAKNNEVRLLLGPFANAADAAAACVLLSARNLACRPNIFAGDLLHDE
ncbi:hypothetical protein HPQ64_13700 [Rhizobiales bacterium]|uniref:hypothetical protein n=1 Tax=Hongsoonwoonella zoysiae TaxID=2821844 RepID=UPI00155FE541|nr:hypothetical protein [Hongsoonwoonella zoysiae]NRG18742.1 hypothetical protein [Hongsoonwoonella zoysiae]